MKNIEILRYLVKKFNFNSGTLGERMISQKAMYILQKMGVGTDYSFNWYIYGVYSQELADDLYLGGKPSDIPLSEKMMDVINKFRSFSEGYFNDPSFFELASSIIYLWREEPFVDKERIFEKIVMRKPHLNDPERFDLVYKKLADLKIVS
jgi:hypothetical protein